MKKITKPKVTKNSHKGITKGPIFKKPKSTGKLVLSKDISIDENTIKKTKLDKTKIKTKQNQLKNANETGKQQRKSLFSVQVKDRSVKLHGLKEKGDKPLPKLDVPTVAKTPKKVLPTKYVTEEVANKAVQALEKLAKQSNKNKLFDDEPNVHAQLMCIKIQSKKTTIKINLPHSTVASTGEVCLITTDLKKGRKHDHEPSIDLWEEKLRKAGVTKVKTVLPIRQLRVEYDQFELKRRLLTQHDFILVDSRIHGHVCHILGKMFVKKHNMCLPVRLENEKHIKKSIDYALNTTLLHLSEGATSAVTIGHMGMSGKELKENILGLVKELAKKFPGGEQNIRSLSVKLPLSLAVPLYVTLRSKKTISAPKIRTELPKKHQVVEGELTTVPGSIVKISPEGNVVLVKGKSDGSFSDEDEEFNDSDNEDAKPKNKKKKLAKRNDIDEDLELSENEEVVKPKNKKKKLAKKSKTNEDKEFENGKKGENTITKNKKKKLAKQNDFDEELRDEDAVNFSDNSSVDSDDDADESMEQTLESESE